METLSAKAATNRGLNFEYIEENLRRSEEDHAIQVAITSDRRQREDLAHDERQGAQDCR